MGVTMFGSTGTPEGLPILSPGKHRSQRKGACFMELASVLAGERWSDHPTCTHPLLAELARLVNDHTTDAHRHELAVLIPSVVGLTTDDPRLDARIALRCATVALPIAAADRQNALAVSLLAADSVLAQLDGDPGRPIEDSSGHALDRTPQAASWGRSFLRRHGVSVKGFRRWAAPNTVRLAIQGIAVSYVADSDAVLRGLLTDVIADATAICAPAEGREPAGQEGARPSPSR
jgi:hypothetical protein